MAWQNNRVGLQAANKQGCEPFGVRMVGCTAGDEVNGALACWCLLSEHHWGVLGPHRQVLGADPLLEAVVLCLQCHQVDRADLRVRKGGKFTSGSLPYLGHRTTSAYPPHCAASASHLGTRNHPCGGQAAVDAACNKMRANRSPAVAGPSRTIPHLAGPHMDPSSPFLLAHGEDTALGCLWCKCPLTLTTLCLGLCSRG